MPDVKISQLPAGTANASAVVPATNAAGTTTEKVTLSAILALQHNHSGSDITSGTVAAARLGAHASGHQTGGADAIANVVVSPAEITADQNNYSPGTGDIFRLTANAARNITGIVAGSSGQAILLINVDTTDAITLKHENASSTAANRLAVPWEGDYVLSAKGGAALLVYDATASRWRVV
jgi:hypothetical protein